MPTLSRYDPPAFQQIKDIADPDTRAAFEERWSQNVDGWTQQARLGNPWNAANSSPQDAYFDPLVTDFPDPPPIADVTWGAFPARIGYYYPGFNSMERFEFADTGLLGGAITDPIPSFDEACGFCGTGPGQDPCPERIAYGPYGPRGFQDEYCEWAVKREGDEPGGRITRIDFTCENPEYWQTLWAIDPDIVHNLYREITGKDVAFDDLVLKQGGQTVTDPITGRAAYNPLNKWNNGPVITETSGGAIHLTATPNTVPAQIGLAGGASTLRKGDLDSNALLCCSDYGQPFRNSDPSIGQKTNDTVRSGNQVTLANPISLYGQLPDFGRFDLPEPSAENGLQPHHTIEECWQITRGETELSPDLGFPSSANFILHVRFEIPQSWKDEGVTIEVGDIEVDKAPLRWGSQVAATFNVGLFPIAIAHSVPDERDCLFYLDVDGDPPAIPQPLQCMDATLWDAYNSAEVPNPMGITMHLSSNTILMPPYVARGSTYSLVVTCDSIREGTFPKVAFMLHDDDSEDTSISVTVTDVSSINYAIPGFTYPSDLSLLSITVDVSSGSPIGQRDIRIWNDGDGIESAVSGKYFLWVEE